MQIKLNRTYRIDSAHAGHVGTFRAESDAVAMAMMVSSLGYDDVAAMAEEFGMDVAGFRSTFTITASN